MRHTKRVLIIPVLSLLIVLLSSCIGVKADITLAQNGSGSISLEYRFSQVLESLGKLDGNERWLTIPVGKSDFERTVARVEGLRLRSFSSKEAGQDRINQVKLEFTNLQALVRFLDATGQRAVLVQEQGKNRLFLTLSAGTEQLDPDLLNLFTTISQGYSLGIHLSLPGQGTLVLQDGNRKVLDTLPGVQVVPEGEKVSFLCPVGNIFSFTQGIGMEITWNGK